AIDTLRPTANIVVAEGTLKAGQTSLVTITFSEAVTDFTNTDLSVTGGRLSPVQSSDGGSTWTATLTPPAGTASTGNTITLDNTGVQNAAGNAGSATTGSNAYSIDTLRPTASIVVANAALKTGQTSLVTITFSEAVTGFTNAGLTIEGGSLSPVHSSDGGITWTATFTPASGTEQANQSITLDNSSVSDAAGNAGSGTTRSNTYTIDTRAPTLQTSTPLDDAINVSPGANLTLTFSENVVAAEGLVELRKTSDNTLVEQFDVTTGEGSLHGTLSIQGSTLTLNPHDDLIYDTGYYLLAEFGVVKDSVGNYFGGISAPTALNFQTVSAPSGGGAPVVPPATAIDGVQVTTQPGPGGSTVVTVPVVAPERAETPGTPSPLADIPLVKAVDGHTVIGVSLPVGVGLQAESITTTGTAQLAELLYRIERVAGSGDQALLRSGEAFTAALNSAEPLTVQVLQPTPGAGFNPAVPLVITGSTLAADGKQAIVLDARALPSGTVIQVDNIDFIAVVGSVRLIGGAGQNVASGDNEAQWIVLGPDDDIIHGGGGNDVVGSEGGDDQVFGDAGDDTVFGGAGNDILSGGTGNDHLNGGTGFDVALQAGKRADYTITLEGAGIKMVHTATGETDWLVDVEQVRFDSGPILTIAHSAAEEAAAFLFSKWLGRDLTQSEGAIIQTLEGHSAEQVASLFAQVFPTQTAGKTPAQLLEGLAAAGAIRVDAIREVTVTGDGGNNTITPTLGLARYVDGGAGTDTVVIPASLGQTHVQHNANGSFTLQRLTDGAMLDVSNVERVDFSDTKLALDLNGHAGQAAKLLGALAGPAALANKGLVGEAIRLLDAGMGEQGLAQLGLQALGAQTPAQVAQLLWTNVVGRAGTAQELTILTDLIGSGVTASELAVMAASLDLNATRIDLVGLTAKGIEFA
ncbi:Ig-like domain-containing protein, partial [Acidovorax sp.]|uniref:Ig-like domain-containing protein n=1 Tax=Acidovorax sp. TaxID=1872122 RepID=UPI00391F84AF